MKIRSLAYADTELKEPLPNDARVQTPLEETEETIEKSLLDSVNLHYIDPKTGIKKAIDEPSVFTANDGTSMMNGVIKIEGVAPEQIQGLMEQGLLEKIVAFINRDTRINIDIDSLITDKIHKGFVSFIITPAIISISSSKKITIAAVADQNKIDKICKSFFAKFKVGEDLSDFNIDAANEELYSLLEKVAVNINILEKKKIMKHIKNKLSKHNIKLIYIENNLF